MHIRLNGIRDLATKPDAIFIVDIKREHNALAEARRLRVPIVAIVDTNTDPTLVDYPIAGNDDAIRSIKAVLGSVARPMLEARAAYEAASAKMKADAEAKAEKQEPAPAELEAETTTTEPAPAGEVAADAGPAEVPASAAEQASAGDAPGAPTEPVEA